MYRVVLVTAGCCQSQLNVGEIGSAANKMANEGYELAHIYESSAAGCCIQRKTSAVLVFKKTAP